MIMSSITISDVAKKAGVSPKTVSRVLNEEPFVKDSTRERVLKVIRELGYRPNTLARSLRKQETRTIGLVVPNSANPFYADVGRGVEAISFDEGYNLILCNSDRNIEKEIMYADLLAQKQVDGIIFAGAWIGDQVDHIRDLQNLGMPIVVVDRNIKDCEIDSVAADNYQGGWLATNHLLELRHKKIGCIAGVPQYTLNAQRLVGYQDAIREAGLLLDENLIYRADFQYEGGYEGALKLLSLEDRPTAIFAANDLMAVGAIRAALDCGISVPDELSVIGFDDIQMGAFVNPALTTISPNNQRMGEIAMRMLLDRIRQKDKPFRSEVLEVALVERQSSKRIN
jgi:LacI family transcriptional regulator